MRIFKILAVIIILLGGAYAASMYYFVDESKNFTIEKEIDYPVDKVFAQFNNLQNFTRWNNFFTSSPSIDIDYYTPYEGQGSAISYVDPKNDTDGEIIQIKRVNNMLITPMICLTIINWLMAGSGMREAGSYDCADNYYFF